MTESESHSGAQGLLITLEGTEGSGKTTQMRLLVERLRNLGYVVTENQEPGGTAIGKEIRRILLDPSNSEMVPETELLLMFASRAQAVAEIIRPALRRGEIVVSDRYTDSSLAYQGEARGLGFDTVLRTHRLALGELFPSLTVCLDVDVELGLSRANSRNRSSLGAEREARIDRQSSEFHRSVREGYKKIAALEPERFKLVDGSGDPADVFRRVWSEVAPLLTQIPSRKAG